MKISQPVRKEKYRSDHVIGENNVQMFGFDFHNPVFFSSTLLIFLFVLGTLLFPSGASEVFEAAKGWSIQYFDWFFMVSINIILIVCLLIAVLPFGRIRLGGPQSKPEFGYLSWFAMLFSAGMGIGLMFWGVAEPVAYYTDWYGAPLNIQQSDPNAKSFALFSGQPAR